MWTRRPQGHWEFRVQGHRLPALPADGEKAAAPPARLGQAQAPGRGSWPEGDLVLGSNSAGATSWLCDLGKAFLLSESQFLLL